MDDVSNMKWVTNVGNPTLEYAQQSSGMDDDEWKEHLAYIAKFTKGAPKASNTYTVDQLMTMGLIGLYKTK